MWPTLFEIPFLNMPIRGYGLMLMIGFLGGTWWATRRALRVKANPDLVVNLGFIALLASVVGARLFYVIHYWDDHFAGRSLWAIVNITQGGLEFYGGFIGALVGVLVYLWYVGVSLRLYLDITAPSLAFGLAVTRIGCFLNGCCWGGPCPAEMPWAVQFPYMSPAFTREWTERQVALPAELIWVSPRGTLASPIDPSDRKGGSPVLASQAYQFRSLHLHPAQLYAAINAGLLALVMNAWFYRRKRHGTVFAIFLFAYPFMRIIEETIRVDNPHDTAGLTISQFVSLLIFTVGAIYLIIISRLPVRSPKAVPWVPPWLEEEAASKQPRPAKAKTRR
jgi:phosphatidylglycerol:prolipoprotein diacylglycerol transferase